MTKVPKGTRDEANTTPPRTIDQRATTMACRSAAQNRTNSAPWSEPAILTATGRPARYLSGIAIPRRSR